MFYTTFEELCRERNVAPSAVSRKLGMSSSAPGRWKTGSSPDLDTAQKIADFFGVTIDFLVNNDRPGTISNTRDSVILQGNQGNNAVANGSAQIGGNRLTDQEEEMLRLFRGLDMRKKTAALSYLYELEDGGK